MEFRELTNILTIAEEGSLSKAAEKLFVSQSSLSQFLKSYEAAIGCSLFVRTSTGMRPTEAGERVLEAAHQIVAIGNNLQNELWDIANLSTGKVSLGLTPFRGSFVLPDILPAFYAKYPSDYDTYSGSQHPDSGGLSASPGDRRCSFNLSTDK